jgi:hypothetical protein
MRQGLGIGLTSCLVPPLSNRIENYESKSGKACGGGAQEI